MNKTLSPKIKETVLKMQLNEITESHIYDNIANRINDTKYSSVLHQLASEEYKHSQIWKSYTQEEISPNKFKIWFYNLLSIILGYTFTLKLMEASEEEASATYNKLAEEIPEAHKIAEDENRHEQALLAILDEERLQYVGSMVLGLNDALVELTGTLAGLTLAMQNTRIIAMAGLITGISATLSMASSEYLAARSEGRENALKSCTYTGVAYCLTVALLVAPYLLLPNHQYLYALAAMLIIVICIIFFFTYYISVAKDLSFKHRFTEMAAISLGVAAFSFCIGIFVKNVLGIDM